ncbi:MAG: outer membrane protein assembly factor BamA [Gammaproteobacteria bacterium]|nr:outer membrane protein assembly factor BamA [Pseudomonadales bacterium]MCP5346416.1 outer membrane protein assembly factor BamA [Pseudomonadales bacterium]
MKRFCLGILLFIGFANSSYGQSFTIADIIIDGYQRVSPGVIYGLLPVGIGDEVTPDVAADIIRALSDSGYFEDIEVLRDGNLLVISILERPSVAEINIEGNSVLETDQIIENMASAEIAEGQIFTRSTLEAIRQGIQDVYSSRGRYGATVDIEVEELPRNRVAINLDINEGEESRIRHINIVGNNAFDDDELLDLFEQGTKPWYLFFSRRDRYSREQFSGDLERLESFYLDNGYVEFNVDSTPISITPDKEEIYITVNITEGPQFTVNEVDLAGDLVDAEALLRAAIFVRPGQTYSQALVTGTEEIMVQFLGNLGYAFAQATGVPEINEGENTVDVTFFIDPGNRTYVNRINFSGNLSTADEVLRREMRQLESAPASSQQIEQSKVRLERLGYFETVEVETVEVPGTEDQIDVNYDVVEQNFGSVNFSVGGGGGNFFVSTSLQAQNFLGTGKTVGFGINRSRFSKSLNIQYLDPYFTPDGVSRGFNIFAQEIDSPFNIASFNTSSYGAGFNFSYPMSEVEALGFDIGYAHTELSSGYGSVQEIESSPNFKLFPSITKYLISPGNTNPWLGPVQEAVLGNVSDLTDEQLRKFPDPGFIDRNGDTFDNFTVTGTWFRNTLNRGQLPNDGSLHTLGVEVSLPGSDLEYATLNYQGQMYWPVTNDRNWVVALRYNFGYGFGYGKSNEMPFFQHYFAGGITAQGVVRGFDENSLGPQSTPGRNYNLVNALSRLERDENGNVITDYEGRANAEGYEPVWETTTLIDELGNEQVALAVTQQFLDRDYDSFGGNILTTGSLELIFPLPFIPNRNQVRSSFFIDGGNVFSSNCTATQKALRNCSDFDVNELRFAAGIGITYLSPFGPLTFYLATPIKEGQNDDTKTFDFTIGTGF